MSQVLDYSAGYPNPAVVKRMGFDGAVRYLRKEGSSSVRPITSGEMDGYHRLGLGIALIYQHVSRNRPSFGYNAGVHDAQWARARALEVGPSPRAIYFAVDYDAPTADWPAIREYARGWGDFLGKSRAGVYAKYTLLDHLFSNGLITWGWQTYAWSPGHNQPNQTRHPKACLFQNLATVVVDGVACDVNDVLAEDWGQHNYVGDIMTPDQERKLLEDVAETRRLIEALNDGATAYLPPERRNIGTWAAEVRQSLANTEGAVARVEANPGANVQELAEALAPLLQQETGAVTSGDLAAAVDGLLAQLPPAVLQLLKSKL